MKDAYGNKIKKGDILIELHRGGKIENNVFTQFVLFWEVLNVKSQKGINYNICGKRFTFLYVDVKNSIKINLSTFPKEFLYYFRHSLNGVYCDNNAKTQEDIIKTSDWNKRKKEVDKSIKYLCKG